MARRKGWFHKTRIWKTEEYETRGSNDHQDWIDQEELPFSFSRWLDWQCEGGWDLVSVHRQLLNDEWVIWCVFRCPIKRHSSHTYFDEKFRDLEP